MHKTPPVHKKIFVAVSGGVDSSVALALLKEQGFEVVGCFMKNWSQNMPGLECNWVGDREDALRVCAALGVPFRTVDLEKIYFKKVFKNFISEYRKGRTPNPDILCNSEVKFKAFLNWAIKNGADAIATGHYARIRKSTKHKQHKTQKNNTLNYPLPVTRYALLASRDGVKDQSYFLYRLGQKELSRAMFPVGEMTKPEVRKRARQFGLSTATKPDSQGVCFVGEVALQQFLKNWIPEKTGKIVKLSNASYFQVLKNMRIINNARHGDVIVGEHRGVWYYTIGQRHGLGVKGGGEPLYVVAKDVEKNILYVAPKDHPALYAKELRLMSVHWVSGIAPRLPYACKARIRYRQKLQSCTVLSVVSRQSSNVARLKFTRAQWAPAPGQSVVFYDGAEVLGGGIIV